VFFISWMFCPAVAFMKEIQCVDLPPATVELVTACLCPDEGSLSLATVLWKAAGPVHIIVWASCSGRATHQVQAHSCTCRAPLCGDPKCSNRKQLQGLCSRIDSTQLFASLASPSQARGWQHCCMTAAWRQCGSAWPRCSWWPPQDAFMRLDVLACVVVSAARLRLHLCQWHRAHQWHHVCRLQRCS
jgi:hypothetical protein